MEQDKYISLYKALFISSFDFLHLPFNPLLENTPSQPKVIKGYNSNPEYCRAGPRSTRYCDAVMAAAFDKRPHLVSGSRDTAPTGPSQAGARAGSLV